MTARRPKVPRAGRPLPMVEDRPVSGDREGFDTAHTHRSAAQGAAPVRTGANLHTSSMSRGAGPSATKDPRVTGMTTTHAGVSSAHRVTHAPRGTTSRAVKPTSPSQARAAERSELAGSIRRGRLGSRRAESVIQPAEEATPIPAKSFSGRLLALAFVVVVVIVLLAPSVTRYFHQQSELHALRADIALQQELQADYRTELARWEDPAFVKQQARERIFLVMPGETRYLVKGGTGIEEGTGEGSAADPGELPWADALWESVERAATD
jgi:cell division protein FtsB